MSVEPHTAPASHPRLILFDPADDWPNWKQAPLLPLNVVSHLRRDGSGLRVTRIRSGPLPEGELMLVVLPDRGLDSRDSQVVRAAMEQGLPCCFCLGVDEDLLTAHPRSGFGFDALRKEVQEGWGAELFVVPLEGAPDVCEVMLNQLTRLLLAVGHERQHREQWHALGQHARRFLSEAPPQPMTGLKAAIHRVAAGRRSRQLLEQLAEARRAHVKAKAETTTAGNAWMEHTLRARDRCVALGRGAKYHGAGAEDLIGDLVGIFDDLRQQLDTEWCTPPFPELGKWVTNALDTLNEPEVVLPVVGVFSCGKTTLFNHLLGGSVGGKALLRTSPAHNTALLSRFRHRGHEPENHVRIRWRPHVEMELLWHGDRTRRPIRAPVTGQVEQLQEMGEGTLVVIRSAGGDIRWLHVGAPSKLLPGIRVGVRVRVSQPLSDGIDEDAADMELKRGHSSDVRLHLRPRATAELLGFLDREQIQSLRFHVRSREFKHLAPTPYILTPEELSPSQPRYRELLDWLRTRSAGNERRLEMPITVRADASWMPVSIRAVAEVVSERCQPTSHRLETDEDWTWFQGPAEGRDGSNGEAPVGFAESPEVAWLVEGADLHLDSPLFRLVSMVDTPGLNSISEHHDRTTEEFIHRGQAFLLMARLGRDSVGAATERIIQMMRHSLAAQGIHRSEWGSRIFVVLNRFAREAGARDNRAANESVLRFRERLASVFDGVAPRLYVVELAPKNLAANEETYLGFPSLKRLKEDLRSLLAVRGMAVRFDGLRQQLESAWSRHRSDLDTEEKALQEPGSQSERTLLQKRIEELEPGGRVHRELHGLIAESLEDLLRPARQLYDELRRDYDDQSDFESLQESGTRLMRDFNVLRNELVTELPGILASKLREAGKRWVRSNPDIPAPRRLVDEIPTMPDSTFEDAVGNILGAWPGGFRRFLHALGNFEYYATTRRKELREGFAPQSRQALIQRACEAVKTALEASVSQASTSLLAQLRERYADITASHERRVRRLEELWAERRALEAFEPAYTRMVLGLGRVVTEVQSRKKAS